MRSWLRAIHGLAPAHRLEPGQGRCGKKAPFYDCEKDMDDGRPIEEISLADAPFKSYSGKVSLGDAPFKVSLGDVPFGSTSDNK